MSSGIRALIRAAATEPLDFHISMYCGGMVITGRVAPADSWYEATKFAHREAVWESLVKVKDREDRVGQLDSAYESFSTQMARISTWWIVDGKTLKGRRSPSLGLGVGVIVPMGD